MNYTELLTFAAPETLIVIAALAALAIDLTTMRESSRQSRLDSAVCLTVLGAGAAMVATFLVAPATPPGYLDGILVLNPLTQLLKLTILALTIFTALMARDSNFTDHVGEYFALLLLATAGMMFLVSTDNLLLLFVALELLSLCLYIMTAFNKQNVQSVEAALKYFLFGGMSAAFLLFGISLVQGLSGEMNLTRMAAKLGGAKLDPLLVIGMLMVVTGFGFKVAAVPFHLWAPDAYQGAPTPTAAFIASGSKVASFFILAKVMMVGFAGAEGSARWWHFVQGWVPILAVVAALSVVLGNLAAIVQGSVRRLLAYSAIAQAGYVLVGILANERGTGMASVLFYVTTYALTTVGAFAVVAIVQERAGDDRLSAFAGLSRREPFLSCCMMIFLLSLAGIPPLAGFFGKFYLFKAALFTGNGPQRMDLLWLVILALAMSAVSLYYYLQVLKQIFVAAAPADSTSSPSQTATRCAVGLAAFAVVLFGVAPSLLLEPLLAAMKVSGY